MDFLDQLVIPPSANHVLLLRYVLVISMLLFVPYLGMVLGASFYSVIFKRMGRKQGNSLYARFAKDIIEKLTITKNAEITLGIIPALSITFVYAQLLYQAKTIVMSSLSLAVLMFIISFVLIYKYRASFRVSSVLDTLKTYIKDVPQDADFTHVNEYEENLQVSGGRSGVIGMNLLYAASYIFAGSVALASNPGQWSSVNNILQVFFSWETVFSFIFLLAISGAITGAAVLFYFFKWQGGIEMDEEYSKFVKNLASGLAFYSTLAIPLLLFISFILLPQAALSPASFVYLAITLVSSLVLANMLYPMYKNSDVNFSTGVFVLVFILFTFNILKDQSIMGNALQEQTKLIITKSEELKKEVKAKTVSTTGVNAEQIYSTKCIACHKFDVKVVGPPYQQTVPKYNGDVNALAEFIYNPIKKDAAYPPMPNQGLKKKEAQAMAKWLMDQVSGKK
jgi:cytochrome c551/c552